MTDKLISDLGSIGAAIADNTATEVQRNGQTTTEQALGSDWKTYIQSWLTKAMVGLGNVANSLQLVAASNLSDLANVATARSNLGMATTGATQFPFYGDANTGIGPLFLGNAASLTLTNQRLYMVPFIVPEAKTFVGLSISVVTREAAKGIRIGIYNANQTTRQPTTLVVDAGVVDLDTTTGVVNRNTKTISQNLTPGLYYAAFLSSATGTGVITGIGTVVNSGVLGLSLSSGGAVTPVAGFLLAGQTYQAFATALSDVSAQTFTPIATGLPLFVLN